MDTGFDQGFKTDIVFRRPRSTLEARRSLHFPSFEPDLDQPADLPSRVGSSSWW